MILRPSGNIWRLEPAGRAAVLVDGGAYFAAVRAALIQARSTIFIVGWDLDSRTRIVGESGRADDGYPETLIELLTKVVRERPKLTVHLLVWDYSVIYSLEREMFPLVSMQWRTPRRIRFCLDDDLPAGASHHQKLVVIDDSIAFCGGVDLTTRRWDNSQHELDNPNRVDPAGAPYQPYHDVQMMVDGKAAQALAQLVRERWARAACERPRRIGPAGDRWPKDVTPDFTETEIGIARTAPGGETSKEIREIEALYLDAIDSAERTIYLENQYLTVMPIAERLARRMTENKSLEVLIVAPQSHHSWLESKTMHQGRIRFVHALTQAGVGDRVRLMYPQVRDGERQSPVMVHSKLMIVDDVLLRVGSANLNNRSIGLDTECDLVVEAKTADERKAISAVRNGLIGHFCGVTADEVAASLAQTGSLLATAAALARDGHSLQPIDDGAVVDEHWTTLTGIADPERPIAAPALVREFVGERPRARRFVRLAKLIALATFVLLLMAAWQFTPLASLTDPDTVRESLEAVAEMPGAPLIVAGVFVLAGLVAFPVTLLIAATAAAFGPLLGFTYATLGAVLSAIVTYAIGLGIGRDLLMDVLGPRLNRVRRSIAKRGVLAVAAVRLVPIAPFTLVNLTAGASRIPFTDYVLGTLLGMAPGLVVMSALGYQVLTVLTQPTLGNVLLFVSAVIAWVAVSLGVQAAIMRRRGRTA